MIKSHVFITFEPGAGYALPEISEYNNGPLFERPFTEDEIFEGFKSRVESLHEDFFGYSGEDGEDLDDDSTLAQIEKDSGWRSANRDQWWGDIYENAYLVIGGFKWEDLVEEIANSCIGKVDELQGFAKIKNLEVIPYKSKEDLIEAILNSDRTKEEAVVDIFVALSNADQDDPDLMAFKEACQERLSIEGLTHNELEHLVIAMTRGKL